jgi:type II secretory pathway component PulF
MSPANFSIASLLNTITTTLSFITSLLLTCSQFLERTSG